VDIPSQHAAQLLSALAAVNERLVALANTLRSRPAVAQVLRDVDFRSYGAGPPLVEAYVESTCANGDAICYWLELSWADGHWLVGARITINRPHEDYQDTLSDFPDRCASTMEGVIAALDEAVTDLVRAADHIHPLHLGVADG